MKKIKYYSNLLVTDPKALRYQLWMVWNRHKINFVKWLFKRYAHSAGKFLTVHTRPLNSASIHTWSDFTAHDAQVAIVLQGPLVSEHDFTLETVKLYKQHFPASMIIVSTWKDESATKQSALATAGAVVVTSTKPTTTGIGNVNLQLTSTVAGIKKAKEMGAEFVYKTRCDQRAYAPNLNEFLIQLLNTFPPHPGFLQKYRIVGSSFGTLKYVPYLFTDVFQFGHIDDMLRYWSAPHDSRSQPSKFVNTVKDLIDEHMCEAYLCSTYLESIGRKLDWSIHDSWRAFADHFVIADQAALDLFFYKYNYYIEHHTYRYDGISNSKVITFSDWLALYNNRTTLPTPPEGSVYQGRHDLLSPRKNQPLIPSL